MNTPLATPWEKFKGLLFHLFPHHWVSRITFWFTRQRLPLLTPLIKLFVRFFKVDMHDAEKSNLEEYQTFNEFFTRTLKVSARPIDSEANSIVSPCDGKFSQCGTIHSNSIIQAKGKLFTIEDFCTPASKYAHKFKDGSFCTIYLSPRDYHRVHIPCNAKLVEMVYVPGRLFSVAPYAPKTIDKLYARNERVISVFQVNGGYMALVMVGAVNVSAIEMAWAGLVTPPHMSTTSRYSYEDQDITLNKGSHAGTFNMGSTVVVLFSKECAELLGHFNTGDSVKMGQKIGRLAQE